MASLAVEILDRVRDVPREDWESLWKRCPTAHVYQTHAWYAAWQERFAAEGPARIVTVRAGRRLVGACPLLVTTQRARGPIRRTIATLLSSQSAAYPLNQGPLVDPAHEEETLRAMADVLVGLAEPHTVFFDLFERGGPAERLLEAAGERLGRAPHYRFVAGDHLVPLAGDYEEFLASLPRKTRQNVRRYERNFPSDAGGSIRVAETAEEVERTVDALRRQKRRRMARQGLESAFEEERMMDFLRDVSRSLFERGRLFAAQVRLGEEIVGTRLTLFDEHGHGFAYASSFDPADRDLGLGYLLDSLQYREAIRRGCRRLSLSTGQGGHKRLWSQGRTRALYQGSLVLRSLPNVPYALYERAHALYHQYLRAPAAADARAAGPGGGARPGEGQDRAAKRSA